MAVNLEDASWRELITDAMARAGETWADVVACTLEEHELDVRFDDGFGIEEGKPFTVWTHNRVYFPSCYDGSEDCVSVSRRPDGKPTYHVGGG